MTKDEALKMCLEYIETDAHERKYVRHAIKEALAQPEPRPVAKNELGRIKWLVDDWPANCFLYAEPPTWTPVEIGVDVTPEGAHVVAMYVLPDAVRYVFYSHFHQLAQPKEKYQYGTPLLDAMTKDYVPPQRTWVGLTDEEIEMIYAVTIKIRKKDIMPEEQKMFAKTIEQFLKERNT